MMEHIRESKWLNILMSVLLAVLFGLVSAATFTVVQPRLQKKLNPQKPDQVWPLFPQIVQCLAQRGLRHSGALRFSPCQ